MAEWFIYQTGGAHLGPWSTETIARGIVGGQLPSSIYVGVPGSSRWLPAMGVPVIAQIVARATVQRAPSVPPPLSHVAASLVPLAPHAPHPPKKDMSVFAGTMMVGDDEVEIVDAKPARPNASSIPPPLPHPLASTLRMPSSPPLPSEKKRGKITVARKSLAQTFVLSDGPTSELLRRPSDKPPPRT